MNDYELVTQLQALLNNLDDTHPAAFVLTTLCYALERGRTGELEEQVAPLADKWLDESLGAEGVDDGTLQAYRETVL